MRLWPSLLISAVIMAFWLRRYLSSNKTWFFQTSSSAVVFGVARFWYYVTPCLAFAFLLFGISTAMGGDPYSMVPVYWVIAGWGCIILGFVFGFLQPIWFSPSWLRQLKREYGKDTINLLIEDAVGMDKYELERRLKTWEAIEAWVAETRRKHGL